MAGVNEPEQIASLPLVIEGMLCKLVLRGRSKVWKGLMPQKHSLMIITVIVLLVLLPISVRLDLFTHIAHSITPRVSHALHKARQEFHL